MDIEIYHYRNISFRTVRLINIKNWEFRHWNVTKWLSELINIHNQTLSYWEVGKKRQPEFIIMSWAFAIVGFVICLQHQPFSRCQWDGGGNLSTSHREPFSPDAPPVLLLLFLALSLARLLLVSLYMNDKCFMYLPPTEKKPHVAPELTYYASYDKDNNKCASYSEFPRLYPGTDWRFGALCLI